MAKKLIFILLILLSLFVISSCEKIESQKVLKWYYTSDYVDEEGNRPIAGWGANMLLSENKLFAIRGSKMVCFDKNTGEILWYYNTKLYLNYTPILADNKIFILNGSNELRLTVLDLNGNVPDDYSQVVYNNFDAMGNTISAVCDNKIYIQLRKVEPYTYIIATIDINTYHIEEIIEVGKSLRGRLAINNNLLYVPYSRDRYNNRHPGIRAYDLTSKELIWETKFDKGETIVGYNPILYKSKLYVGGGSNTWVLKPETGEIIDEWYASGYNGYAAGKDVLFSSIWLLAIDINTGQTVWRHSVPYYNSSGAVYHNGVFYLMYYGLHAYDAQTGEELAGHSFDDSPYIWEEDNVGDILPIADDDTVYVNGFRGIYAFKALR